ncbi:Bug family tripartite tricarboxylate transporter substrate binding protein [Paracraurococcus lichenis]|uniref:Tripartite tricarboxylate transporter substrate-binding protein n=1 Tax=Paracraurococcus lichenis TaxID=3064888 RepID=A0ABT9DSR8_9PROT|nr:tripartite tricarboxylate transporter substrate-binding protein [Paracraurococcus sp. LOR1-02]MDO9706945.1 tripartite tricarboxylate transporter substrate-binding protein [Paracraurococcus sp. LOR1-02]
MQRRHLIAAAFAAPAFARAQGFDRPLRIIVPNAPGGTSDILARLVAGPLGQRLGQAVIVENRAGAGGNIGADYVAKSAPDGTTLLLLDVSVLATNPFLFSRLPFDVEKYLATVTMLVYAPYILAAANRLPVQDAAGLVAHAKANPGALNVANSGTGTLSHLVAVALGAAWGTEMTHVPYRGGAPALLAVASGEADLTMAGATQSMPYVTGGQMRGIAVSGPRRLPTLPALPTFAELGWPQADAGTWQGVLVQGNTPPALVARLEEALRAAMQEPVVRQRVAELGAELRTDGAAAFRDKLRADTASLGQVIRTHDIRLDQ